MDDDLLEKAIAQVLAPFQEEADENIISCRPFWDFYVVGGRWHNEKYLQTLDQTKLESFYKWCNDENITVSSFQAGKQELEPKHQISKVDQKWNELFPVENKIVKCPIFSHSHDKYENNYSENTWSLKDSLHVKCSRIIFANYSEYGKEYKADYMIEDEYWNGVAHIKSVWDGSIKHAVGIYSEYYLKVYNPEHANKIKTTDEHRVVTVDYHS
jgi:hypothetical protein